MMTGVGWDMENNDGLGKLFFELASESRLGILQGLQAKRLKMQELARELDLTDTEACRQLQRLSEASLVQKQPDGKYDLSNFGKLVLRFIPSWEFSQKHTNYLLDHDFSSLPYEFINRFGELSAGTFCGDTLAALNHVREMVSEADEYIWAMAEQSESSHTPIANEKVSKGVKLRFIMQENLAKTIKITQEVEHLKERRYVKRISCTMLITEKESVINLRRNSGSMDYAGFFGSDEKFLKWTRDLFSYSWEEAEKWYPGIQIR
jgi:predicted transcriptional regulator